MPNVNLTNEEFNFLTNLVDVHVMDYDYGDKKFYTDILDKLWAEGNAIEIRDDEIFIPSQMAYKVVDEFEGRAEIMRDDNLEGSNDYEDLISAMETFRNIKSWKGFIHCRAGLDFTHFEFHQLSICAENAKENQNH